VPDTAASSHRTLSAFSASLSGNAMMAWTATPLCVLRDRCTSGSAERRRRSTV